MTSASGYLEASKTKWLSDHDRPFFIILHHYLYIFPTLLQNNTRRTVGAFSVHTGVMESASILPPGIGRSQLHAIIARGIPCTDRLKELCPVTIAVQGKPCVGIECLQLFRRRLGDVHFTGRNQITPLCMSVEPSSYASGIKHKFLILQLNRPGRLPGRRLHGKSYTESSCLTEASLYLLHYFSWHRSVVPLPAA